MNNYETHGYYANGGTRQIMNDDEAKRNSLRITAELDMLEAMYEEYRLKGRIEREETVELEREWAIN